jgi:hypothetical protein
MSDAIRPFDADRLHELLRRHELVFTVAPQSGCFHAVFAPRVVGEPELRVVLGALGEPWHVLQIVAHTTMLYPLDAAPGLLSAFNSWHGSHLWPTGRLDFTETAESAAPAVRLTACIHYPLRAGIHDELLDELLIRSLGASLEFLRAMHRVAIAGLSSESVPASADLDQWLKGD